MTPETNKLKVRAYFEHADKGDMKAWRAEMTPDAVVQMNGDPEMDMAQVEAMAQMFFTAFSNGRHLFESQVAEGGWVTSRLFWTAVHAGTFNGIPASGRPVRVLGALALDIDPGLGFPSATMLRTPLVAVRLARAAGLAEAEGSACRCAWSRWRSWRAWTTRAAARRTSPPVPGFAQAISSTRRWPHSWPTTPGISLRAWNTPI